MIKYIESKDLFDSSADALVNPVNCVGVMGLGLAKKFKDQFPECLAPYEEACSKEMLAPGKLMFVRTYVQSGLFDTRRPAIILFPTKKHWRGKSNLRWIEQGLQNLKESYREWGISSVAMPQIGCGLGGLEWNDVKEAIERHLGQEPLEVQVHIQSDRQNVILPDILRSGLDVVFVGTTASHTSARRGHYFSHKSNSFYKDLYCSNFTPRLLMPKEDNSLLQYGIGLTDMIKSQQASDDRLIDEETLVAGGGSLDLKLKRYRPKWVCFNGMKAFESYFGHKAEYGEQRQMDRIRVFVVPSTSGRVSSRQTFNGKTRTEWFSLLLKLVRGSK